MLNRRLPVSRCNALRLCLSLPGVSYLLSMMACIVIFSQSSLGQPQQLIAPTDQAQSESPSSENSKTNPKPASVEPLTRQATESSIEINPADQRVMSDIQEIRAMLGGGLKSEFEEIGQTLRQYRASTASPANGSPANASEDQAAIEGDSFSRELGEIVRRELTQQRPQLLPAPNQSNAKLTSQPILRQGDTCIVMRKCARELEAVAASLEQVEAYENADTVRQEAVKLWEKARRESR